MEGSDVIMPFEKLTLLLQKRDGVLRTSDALNEGIFVWERCVETENERHLKIFCWRRAFLPEGQKCII